VVLGKALATGRTSKDRSAMLGTPAAERSRTMDLRVTPRLHGGSLLASFLAMAILSSCGGSGGDDPVPPPAPVAPTASFTRTPSSGAPPLTVQFTDTSAPGSAPITAWSWDFGDGQSSTLQNPSHAFGTGSWNVTLRVTTSVGSNTSTAANVLVAAAPPERIIDSVGLSATSPALPEPDVYGQVLPDYSAELLMGEASLREFRPVVTLTYLTTWAGTLGVNDCSAGAGMAQIPPPASPTSGWTARIPQRSTTHLYSSAYAGNFHDVVWPGPWPARLLLAGVLDAPGDPSHGLSFDLGGYARWESCEERTPVLSDWYTSYEISYNQRMASWPVMRHYRLWKKLGSISLPAGDVVRQTYSWTTGLEQTRAMEFTASVTATGGASGPTVHAELSATVSTTLSESVTFAASSTVSEEFTADRTLRPDYMLQYSVWVLVDRYRIEAPTRGPAPNAWSDPSYVLAASNLQAWTIDVESRADKATQSAWFLR
jgi:PKD repeat protein